MGYCFSICFFCLLKRNMIDMNYYFIWCLGWVQFFCYCLILIYVQCEVYLFRKLENNLKFKQFYKFIVYLKYNLEKNIEISRCEKIKVIKGDNDNIKSWLFFLNSLWNVNLYRMGLLIRLLK